MEMKLKRVFYWQNKAADTIRVVKLSLILYNIDNKSTFVEGEVI